MRILTPPPLYSVTVFLPRPELNDSLAGRSTVLVRVMMDGSTRTLVRRTPRRRIGLTFELTQSKVEELRQLILNYSSKQWRLIDEVMGLDFLGYLMTNPVTIENSGSNNYSVTLEFQGESV